MAEKLVSQMIFKNKLNIFIIIFISHVVTQIANASVLQWTYNKIEPLQISQQTLIRLENYLSGNFYSYTFDKKVTNATSLYFAISQNGFGSVLSYCEDEKIISSVFINFPPRDSTMFFSLMIFPVTSLFSSK
jgi:hypothetical protein